jgi:haloalkane dehalogenase
MPIDSDGPMTLSAGDKPISPSQGQHRDNHLSHQPSTVHEQRIRSPLSVTLIDWNAPGLDESVRLAVVDSPAEGQHSGTFLLLHGEPSWSHLYADWIGPLNAAGYRCVAIDLPGFGRSDKPTNDAWYSYERHCEAVRYVVDTLSLHDVNLVVQDWAGPIGLRQCVDRPELFRRVFIFNTWLHTRDTVYSETILGWHGAATNPDQLGGDMPTGGLVAGSMQRKHDGAMLAAAYDAPFAGYASKAGARAFPAMLPFAEPDVGGADQQQRCHDALTTWTGCPVHVIFSDRDAIFPFEAGEAWAAQIPGATIDRIENAGHFVQADAPADCVAAVLRHCAND